MGGQAFTKLAFPFPRGGGRRPRTPSVRLHKIKRAQTSHAKAKRASKRRKPQPTRPLPGNAAAANNVRRRKSEIKALAQQQRRLPVGSGHRERRGRTRQTTIIEACVRVSTREGNRASLKKKRKVKNEEPKRNPTNKSMSRICFELYGRRSCTAPVVPYKADSQQWRRAIRKRLQILKRAIICR